MERQLSSHLTLFSRLLAVGWIAYFAIATAVGVYKMVADIWLPSPFQVVGFLVLGVGGSVVFQRTLGSLKKVRLGRDGVFVSNFLKEIFIPFSEIRLVDGPEAPSYYHSAS